jgi:outer membrane protein
MIRRLTIFAAALALAPGAAGAESLYDAIALAYQTNPSLRAQREAVRSADEGVIQARAGYGPQVNVTGQIGYQDARVQGPGSTFPIVTSSTTTDYRAGSGSADLSATQPLYTAGSVGAQVRGAGADVLASREALRQAESQVLQQVITAYVDVRRDRETIRILRDEIVALTGEFDETKAKGRLGQVTRTDVAQSEARLLSAQAQLNLAQGRLNISNAEYLNVVGQSPGELAPEPDLPGLPANVDAAFEAADHNNPQLLQAIQTERSAREKVNQAKAAGGPTVSLKFDAAAGPTEPYLQRQYDQSVTAALVFNKPLFTSGYNSSKVRQALDDDNHAQLAIEAARRGVVQLVAQAWDQLASSQSALVIEERQVAVQTVAVQGNRVEERVGQRTTIDLLNAELELANARLGLIQSRHDAYVASAGLLAAMGLLEAKYLTPNAQIYDPTASLKQVEHRVPQPMTAVVGPIDSIAAPSTPKPRLSAPGAGSQPPADMPIITHPTAASAETPQ